MFLKGHRRARRFAHDCAPAATLKNAIEALGVPHTEVGTVVVNGGPATLQRIVRAGDAVEVRACTRAETGSVPRFLADAHLGRLGA